MPTLVGPSRDRAAISFTENTLRRFRATLEIVATCFSVAGKKFCPIEKIRSWPGCSARRRGKTRAPSQRLTDCTGRQRQYCIGHRLDEHLHPVVLVLFISRPLGRSRCSGNFDRPRMPHHFDSIGARDHTIVINEQYSTILRNLHNLNQSSRRERRTLNASRPSAPSIETPRGFLVVLAAAIH